MFKKLLLLVMFLSITSFCFAGIIEIGGGQASLGGYAFTPITKTYSVKGTDTVSGQVVWTPASGKKIVLLGASFSSASAAEFVLESNGATYSAATVSSVIPTSNCTTSGLINIGNGNPIWKGETNKSLYLGTRSGVAKGVSNPHSILLYGYETND